MKTDIQHQLKQDEAEGFKGPAIPKGGVQVFQCSCLSSRHAVEVRGWLMGCAVMCSVPTCADAAKWSLSWTSGHWGSLSTFPYREHLAGSVQTRQSTQLS